MSCSEWKETYIGKIKKEWDVISLKDCTIKITDGTHSTVKDDPNGEYFLLSCKNIKNGLIVLGENERKINYETLLKLRSRTGLQKGDILLTTVGTIGESAIIKEENINFELQRSVAIIRVNTEILLPDFLYYVTKSRIFKSQADGLVRGSVQKCLFIGAIGEIKIPVPSLQEQEKIVNILSSLDDKIELNNEINKTLEEMAKSIFKRWFVDFEFPNEDGQPYKSSSGEMVESELGMIPKGWEIGTLDNIGTFKNGKKIRSELRDDNGKYIIYGSNGIIGKTNEVLQNNNCIILGRVGAYCGSVQLSLEPCWITDNAIIATAKEEKYLPYLHRFLLNYPLRESAGGSAQPLINQSILKSIQTSIPTYDLFEKYDNISKEILFKINQNIKENNKLSEIRDSLLPKLMSGEINV